MNPHCLYAEVETPLTCGPISECSTGKSLFPVLHLMIAMPLFTRQNKDELRQVNITSFCLTWSYRDGSHDGECDG